MTGVLRTVCGAQLYFFDAFVADVDVSFPEADGFVGLSTHVDGHSSGWFQFWTHIEVLLGQLYLKSRPYMKRLNEQYDKSTGSKLRPVFNYRKRLNLGQMCSTTLCSETVSFKPDLGSVRNTPASEISLVGSFTEAAVIWFERDYETADDSLCHIYDICAKQFPPQWQCSTVHIHLCFE